MEICRSLIQQGWTLNDIEDANFETLIDVVCAGDKPQKKKEVSLNDFLKNM